MRLPNGFGTVYKLSGKRRKPWTAAVTQEYTTTQDGHARQKRLMLGYYPTKAEALDALTAWRAVPLVKPEITLAEVYQDWAAIHTPQLAEGTKSAYKTAYKHLSPLHAIKMRDLRTAHLQAVIEGKSHGPAHIIRVLLGMLYKYAVQNDIVTRNYAQYIRIPKKAEGTRDAFSEIEIRKIEQAANDGDEYAANALILIYTGWRISEFLALTPFSYDRAAQTLTGGGKTKAGRNRTVPVHPKIRPHLEAWFAKEPPAQKDFRANYKKMLARVGVRSLTPHCCRHTFATICHTAGADPLTVQRLMGHASYQQTTEYTHTDVDALNKAVSLLK